MSRLLARAKLPGGGVYYQPSDLSLVASGADVAGLRVPNLNLSSYDVLKQIPRFRPVEGDANMEPDTRPRCYLCGKAMTFATRISMPLQYVYRCEACKVEAWVPAYAEPPFASPPPEPQQPVAQQQQQQQPQPKRDEQ
jgi:hypothetical protein